MIIVIDNFLMPWELSLVGKELRNTEFFSLKDHPSNEANTLYPGRKTDEFSRVHPLLDSFIINRLDAIKTIFTANPYSVNQYGHLRLEGDDEEEYIHQDFPFDWAYLIYVSDTNLESGTKMYKSLKSAKDEETAFIKFVQNRILLFDVRVPHMAWGNHGKSLKDGRLTINGFCKYKYD
tara:strand:+ start:637 stop:1170 length:534 start_codon:yes stop_codon:yes gene_type:complete